MTRALRIGHISDLHCTGGGVWQPDAWAAGVDLLNGMRFDVVLVSGDFTDWGLRHEWEQIVPRLAEIRAPKVTCLGNHDARREGWRIYEEMLGCERYYARKVKGRVKVELVKFWPDGGHESALIADASIGERWGGSEREQTAHVYEGGLRPEGPAHQQAE